MLGHAFDHAAFLAAIVSIQISQQTYLKQTSLTYLSKGEAIRPSAKLLSMSQFAVVYILCSLWILILLEKFEMYSVKPSTLTP